MFYHFYRICPNIRRPFFLPGNCSVRGVILNIIGVDLGQAFSRKPKWLCYSSSVGGGRRRNTAFLLCWRLSSNLQWPVLYFCLLSQPSRGKGACEIRCNTPGGKVEEASLPGDKAKAPGLISSEIQEVQQNGTDATNPFPWFWASESCTPMWLASRLLHCCSLTSFSLCIHPKWWAIVLLSFFLALLDPVEQPLPSHTTCILLHLMSHFSPSLLASARCCA